MAIVVTGKWLAKHKDETTITLCNMRILYITSTTELHGSTFSLLSLLEGVLAHGDTPFVVVPDTNGPLCKRLQQKSIQYFKVPLPFFCHPTPRPYGKIWYIFDIKDILKAEYKAEGALSKILSKVKPDLIHTNVGPIVSGHFVAKKHKIPHIWHIREYGDLDFNMKMFPCKAFYRRILAQDYSVAITKDLQQYNRLENNRKSFVIYNGVCSISGTTYIEQKEPYFLSASRVSPEKNIDEIIKAFSIFYKSHPNYKLKILGDGPHNYLQFLKNLCDELSCTGSVCFEGFKKDVFSYMQKTKALVVASPAEGFGRMTAEVIFAGGIVIGKNTGGTKEIIEQSGGFLYSSEKELLAYMEKIANMLENDYHTLVYQSQLKAKELFSKEQYIQNIYQVYRNALKEKFHAHG